MNESHKSIQSVLFDKQLWNVRQCRKWLSEHNFTHKGKVDKRGNNLRFRQYNPTPNGKFRSKKVSDGITFVFEYNNKVGAGVIECAATGCKNLATNSKAYSNNNGKTVSAVGFCDIHNDSNEVFKLDYTLLLNRQTVRNTRKNYLGTVPVDESKYNNASQQQSASEIQQGTPYTRQKNPTSKSVKSNQTAVFGRANNSLFGNGNKKGGADFDLHSNLPKIALNPPGYSYLGPNNPLEKQVDLKTGIPRKGHEPKNNLDKIALKHDLLYDKAEKQGKSKSEILRLKHEADREFIREAEIAPKENLYQKFWSWLSRNILKGKLALGMGMTIDDLEHHIDGINSIEELLHFLVDSGVINAKMLKTAMKHTTLHKIRKQHKKTMSQVHDVKTHRGGELILAIIGLITAIITAITKIIELVIQREQQKIQQEEERMRKEQQAEDSKEQQILELRQMLYDYNEELKSLAAEANMPVKDYIIVNLKDEDSRVNDMKRTILAKAEDFHMTHEEFIDYCLNKIAGPSSWWAVCDLLKIMKKEITSPGTIDSTQIKIPSKSPLAITKK